MVGSFEGRVVAMVGSDHQQIVFAHVFDEFGEALIEGFEATGIAYRVAAMAVFAVELDEVDEA